MPLIDGKRISSNVLDRIKAEVTELTAEGRRPPNLVAVIVGRDPASHVYVDNKMTACKHVGFQSAKVEFIAGVEEHTLLDRIDALNEDPGVDGFIVQLPLPRHISEQKVIEHIIPEKDVDGFHPVNLGRMSKGMDAILPATPAGVMEMLRAYNIQTEGKHCVVIGRSNTVGTPMGILMSRNTWPGNSTVTMCHSKTVDLPLYTRMADILIVAAGRPGMITADMVKEGAVVIDVGLHRIDDPTVKKGYRLCGDVVFDEVQKRASYITPVPGGVGPMTIAMLLDNTMKMYRLKIEQGLI